MGNEDHGDGELGFDAEEEGEDAGAKLVIEGGERFVEEEEAGLAGEGTSQSDPLFFTTGEGVGTPLQEGIQFKQIDEEFQKGEGILLEVAVSGEGES